MRDDAVLGRALPLDRGLGPCFVIYTAHNVIHAVHNELHNDIR